MGAVAIRPSPCRTAPPQICMQRHYMKRTEGSGEGLAASETPGKRRGENKALPFQSLAVSVSLEGYKTPQKSSFSVLQTHIVRLNKPDGLDETSRHAAEFGSYQLNPVRLQGLELGLTASERGIHHDYLPYHVNMHIHTTTSAPDSPGSASLPPCSRKLSIEISPNA
ncbi:unnamed protein product [Protopolystoma xenopodis]|uniref:Uncharacterized protein n=1 Tax=Protopolystoma xenopodis TaxID=117903 RepID=A0A448XNP2_9PLAT|nr:unnamed protein product [Protopolystoma xenopodis]